MVSFNHSCAAVAPLKFSRSAPFNKKCFHQPPIQSDPARPGVRPALCAVRAPLIRLPIRFRRPPGRNFRQAIPRGAMRRNRRIWRPAGRCRAEHPTHRCPPCCRLQVRPARRSFRPSGSPLLLRRTRSWRATSHQRAQARQRPATSCGLAPSPSARPGKIRMLPSRHGRQRSAPVTHVRPLWIGTIRTRTRTRAKRRSADRVNAASPSPARGGHGLDASAGR